MATFPDSISLPKSHRPISRQKFAGSATLMGADTALGLSPSLTDAGQTGDIEKIVFELERLGCDVSLFVHEGDKGILVTKSTGMGCVPTSLWARYNECDPELFAAYLESTGRVEIDCGDIVEFPSEFP